MLAAVSGEVRSVQASLDAVPPEVHEALWGATYGEDALKTGGKDAPLKHKLGMCRDNIVRLEQEVGLPKWYVDSRRVGVANQVGQAGAAAAAKAPSRDSHHPAPLGALVDSGILWDSSLPRSHTWHKHLALFGKRSMSDEDFLVLEQLRIGVHEAGRLVGVGKEFTSNCTADGKSGGVTLRGGMAYVRALLHMCTGAGGAFVGGHHAVMMELHGATRDAIREVAREPLRWAAGDRVFGVGPEGEPSKKPYLLLRPGLLIRLGHELAVVVDASITSGTTRTYAEDGVRVPLLPLNAREKQKMEVYQKYSAANSNMSSLVPFCLSALGRALESRPAGC